MLGRAGGCPSPATGFGMRVSLGAFHAPSRSASAFRLERVRARAALLATTCIATVAAGSAGRSGRHVL